MSFSQLTRRIILLLLGFICLFSESMASSSDTLKNKKHQFISAGFHPGMVFMTNRFVMGDNGAGKKLNIFNAYNLKFGKQTDGSKLWEKIYDYPYWGVGLYHANFYNDRELGSPIAIYGFFGKPLRRYKRSVLNFEMGFGLSWNWEPFHKDRNPSNIAIGSHSTVYIDFGLNYTYQISKQLDLQGGVSFTHFSNGAIRKPNKGLNLFSPHVELHYHLKKDRVTFKTKEIPEFGKPQGEIFFFVAVGRKQETTTIHSSEDDNSNNGKYSDINFDAYTFSTVYQRQISHTFKAGLGLDISYDESIGANIVLTDNIPAKGPNNEEVNYSLGLTTNFEKIIYRFSVVSGVGVYILRKKSENHPPAIYMRMGVKYHFFRNNFIGINVRAYNLSVADYVEWTIGHTFKFRKKR